jgi:acyl transferase domain-containing protein/thioesterase domain-containing protein/aryl carrier-like protein
MNQQEPELTGSEIAVIAMAGRFPGAPSLDQYWTNVRDGVESVRFFSDEELLAAGEDPSLLADPAYVRAWPQLEGIENFDAGFFGMSPRDASVMDPQHRFFLEVAWEAMERAGYSGKSAPLATGVFAATGMNHYMLYHVVPNKEIMRTVGEWLARHNGNDMNFLATRAAYQMNLKGPAMNVQTACSSSLTAIHIACQSLLNRETDLALAGASTMSLPQDRGYLYKQGEILSADGHCRPFDAGSKGTLFGSGTGCVVLKRLEDALEDGDTILAVIRGTAINNDGSQKVGYLAPSVDGQARAVSEALAISGVPAESIGMIEAHGTGTAVGDPIEVEALSQAYAPLTDRKGFIALGSVKANIGHLGEAAGMAGFIKTVLAMQHQQFPPCVNFTAPNPQIDFASSPFFVNTTLAPWPRGASPRRAGVTALGAGGTNTHLILEEAPAVVPSEAPQRAAQLLTISAKTRTALERASLRLADALDAEPAVSLADAAWTLQEGRVSFQYRRTVVGRTAAQVAAALREPQKGTVNATSADDARIVYMFPGGGAQYASMGRELYETEAPYRQAFDECLAEMPDSLAGTMRRLVFPASADVASATTELETPRFALPALFATEYATARLLTSWGLEPAGLIGHSMGEYVAACLAGVFTLRDALTLVIERARLFETLPAGGMLSVELSEAELLPLLGQELSIAAVNGPKLCVASGPVAAIDALQATLQQRDIESTRIHIAVAAHSVMLEPILAEFGRVCARVRFSPPQIPFISNLTGAWITAEEAMDPQYWVRHLRQTVRFGEGLQAVLSSGRSVLVEIGPGRTLCSLARSQTPIPVAIPTLRHPRESASDVEFLLGTMGKVWESGGLVQLSALHAGSRRRRIPLPTYPFEHQRFWLPAQTASSTAPAQPAGGMVRRDDVRDWFSMPLWRRSAVSGGESDATSGIWLVFADGSGVADGLAARRPAGQTVVVRIGARFQRLSDTEFAVRADAGEDFVALFEALSVENRWPDQVVHLWGLDSAPKGMWEWLRKSDMHRQLNRAVGHFYVSQLCIVQAASEQERPLVLSTVARGLFRCADGDAPPDPLKALLLGPNSVAAREAPLIRSRCIDLALGDASVDAQVARLLHELGRPVNDTAIGLRPDARWVRVLTSVPLERPISSDIVVRERATILITGGLSGIGLELAEHLARTAKARLVLIGRTTVPERSEWPAIAQQGGTDRIGRLVTKLLAIEAVGGEVLPLAADVTDVEQMIGVVAMARARFGAISGVIHSAGLIDDGLISLKSASAPTPVITVKALGAMVLDSVLSAEPLDFFIAFSSVSSVLGLEGQVDYTSANAFLDAFIERKRLTTSVRAISIGWNAWREVGMTAMLADGAVHPASRVSGNPGPHPDLERIAVEADGTVVYSTLFSRTRQWLLSEHVVRGGDALIPGTGYLELARAALDTPRPDESVELRNVTFLGPFIVSRSAPRVLRLRLGAADSATPNEREFAFIPDGDEDPCVVGTVGSVPAAPEPVDTLEAIRARLGAPVAVGGFLAQPFMDFGARWGNVMETSTRGTEALVRLQLPAEFHADLATYKLHPALMDMATGGAQQLIPGFDQAKDFYVPFTYERIRLFAGLTPDLFSHVRLDRAASTGDTVRFDVDLYDGEGALLVQIRGFVMKRLGEGAKLNRTREEEAAPTTAAQANLRGLLRLAIAPAEGLDAFDRIMASGLSGHVLASSLDLPKWITYLQDKQASAISGGGDTGDDSAGFARPELVTTYVAPRNDLERELCELWKQLLGVAEIGVHDDFFELGGQSLVAVRLFSRIRKQYKVDLPLSTLFEAPTIAQCAEIIAQELGIDLSVAAPVASDAGADGRSAVLPASTETASESVAESRASAAERGSRWRSLVTMQGKGSRPPFVCVAGMGGTLNNLRKLAMLVGDARPFYGLQPPGADNPNEMLHSVEALAAHYVAELRREQPHGPYFLGGYSGGGVAAFEMAAQLIASGETVQFLGFIDSFSPALPQRSRRERATLHLRRLKSLGPRYVFETLQRLYWSTRDHTRLRVARRLGRVMPDTFRYDAIGASWLVAEQNYRPAAQPLSGALFRAREETALSLWSGVKVDAEHGWGRYLRGGVTVQVCPGNHTTMCDEPNVRVLASKLRAAIDAADTVAEPVSDTPAAISVTAGV